MDKRKADPWYVGVTHMLTSYVTAAIFALVPVAIIAFAVLAMSLDSENARLYISLTVSMVIIPILLFPSTLYSIKFIMERYVISEKERIVRCALISIAVFKIIIDWVTFTGFNFPNAISFLLSLVVFYGVSVRWLEVNEGKDAFNLREIVFKK